jgi:hypothetical protein
VAHRVRTIVAGAALAGLLAACSTADDRDSVGVGGTAETVDGAGTAAATGPTVAGSGVTDPSVAVPTVASGPEASAPTAATVAAAHTVVVGTPRVLLVGDGILWDATPALQAAFDAHGIASRFESYWGFGLTKPDFRDWPGLWPEYVAEERPDVVVVSSGPNDALPRPGGPGGALIAPGDPGWSAWYGGLLDQAAAILTAEGAHVLWLGMLWPGQPEATAAAVELNAALLALAARNPMVTYVDVPSGVAGPDGRYAEFDGSVRLRKPDGEHLCAEGAARYAVVVTAALDEQVGRPRDPAFATADWRHGDWRSNGRYDLDGGTGCVS